MHHYKAASKEQCKNYYFSGNINSYSIKCNLNMGVKEMQNTNFLLLQGTLLLL